MPSTKPPSGTRDFLAVDVTRRHYVIKIIEDVYQRYGFEPLETPAFERLSTLLGKYGEDEKLIFRLLHRGDKLTKALDNNPSESGLSEMGLRYDLTVPLARVVAQYRQNLPRFYKRYQIQPVWRADRPGKGRYREFWQCDLDVAGTASTIVEVEVMSAAAEVMQKLGFDQFAIRINHRQILFGLMEVSGVPAELEASALVAIDKLDKIGEDGVKQELLDRGLNEAMVGRLMPLLQPQGDNDEARLEWLSEVLADSERGMQGLADVRDITRQAQFTAAGTFTRVDPYLARGLGYYTGAIFEIEVPDLNSSLGGGGRYDGLVGMFSKQQIPACGFSLGLERILVVMEDRAMFPDDIGGPQVMVSVWNEETMPHTLRLVGLLREAGLRVDLFPQADRYGRQFKYAEERNIRYVVMLGERELADDVVGVKDLESGEQVSVKRDDVAEYLVQAVSA
ncbi:MAG: histidine--tRNA ligase [Chloroflexota bacterium]